jgi:YHS domain-containing protein
MPITVKDPVCGMTIDPATAAGKSDYNGVTYYFCSLGCKASFDKDPVKYLTSGAGAKSIDSPPIVRH